MQFVGCISILIGLLYFRTVAGILLIIIGIAVAYIAWKSKKSEAELSRKLLQEQIKITGIKKKVPGLTPPSASDLLTNALSRTPNNESQKKNIKKPSWFIYTK
jgi:hypothetical protein